MKIKMKYDCERTGGGILYGIWIMVGVPEFFTLIKAFKTNDFSFWNFGFGSCALLGFGLIITLIYMPTYISVKKNIRNIESLKLNGKKAKGRIIDYSANNYRMGSTTNGYEYYTDYYVTVSYFDEFLNKENTITTPKLTFNPQSDLGAFNCTVYYSEKQYYVTDFVQREKEQENIWGGKKIDSLEKSGTKKVIIYITIFMIVWIAVVTIGLLATFGIIHF